MPTLLLCGDFACHTGLARINEALADGFAALGWEIAVLAVNYHGDAHPAQMRYRLYPAEGGGDSHGVGRIAGMVRHVEPDAILLVHDAWNACDLLAALPEDAPPIVAYAPVDGTSLKAEHVKPLNRCAVVVAYTQFGLAALRQAGLDTPTAVIPHGIDLALFQPLPQAEARALAGLSQDVYAVLILDQNQPRKRLDIAFEAFAQFAEGKQKEVVLVYHGPLITRNGWDTEAMADDLGIGDRLISTTRHVTPTRGVPTERLKALYSMCDVKLSGTSGEGWGLTTMEAMACGLPCIVPDFAALAEWAKPAALSVPTSVNVRHCGGINTVGRVPTPEALAIALGDLYRHPWLRAELAQRGLELVRRDCYRWETIAAQFDAILRAAIANTGDTVRLTSPAPALLQEAI